MSSLEDSEKTALLENGFSDLAERDKAFAVEYLANGFNHGAAAESVGLNRTSGLRKLRDPSIGAFIEYLQSQHLTGRLITQKFVEQQYLEILPKLKGEEDIDVVDHKEGSSFRAKKFHSAELVSVLRDLGKGSGYIAPEIGPGGSPVNIQINLGDIAGDDSFRPEVGHNSVTVQLEGEAAPEELHTVPPERG